MTHNDRVLALLSDGKPHAHMELYRLGVIAHSRVADLRKRGHNIVVWREEVNDETVYLYLLDSLEEPTAIEVEPGRSLTAGGIGSLSEPEQLRLTA